MKNPDPNVLQALIRLEATLPEEYTTIQNWFLETAHEKDETLRQAENTTLLHRAQGASRVLLGFLAIAAEPRKYAEQIRSAQQKKVAALPGGKF